MTHFVVARVMPYADEEIDAYIDRHEDAPPTDQLAYFDVYSDDVCWIRNKDRAMEFNAKKIARGEVGWFDWVLKEMDGGTSLTLIPVSGNKFD